MRRFIVDSGSDMKMVNNDLYRVLGIPNLSENGVKLTGIRGDGVIPSDFYNANIQIDDISVNCDIYVLQDLQYEMLLGNNCLSKLNFEIPNNSLKVTNR